MDDFPGILARDFGFAPKGKAAPMSASKSFSSIGAGAGTGSVPARSNTNTISSFDDVFGGPPKYPNPNPPPPSFDSIFDGFKDPNPNQNPNPNPKSSSMPVYDKPVYDDDIFDGVPGIRSSAKVEYEDVFATISKGSGHVEEPRTYDYLLGGLGRSSSSRTESKRSAEDLLGGLGRSSSSRTESKRSEDLSGFEELIPGFGFSSPPSRRDPQQTDQQQSSIPAAKQSTTLPEDPFVILETSASPYPSSGMFTDPLEQVGRPMNAGGVNVDASPASGGLFDDIDAFDGLAKSMPTFTSEKNQSQRDRSPLKSGPPKSSVESFDNVIPKTHTAKSFDSRNNMQIPKSNDGAYERNGTADQSPGFSEHLEMADEVWLTVAEIPLFTQPTSAPPPSRPPPPLVIKSAPFGRTEPRRKDNESYLQSSPGYQYPKGSVRRPSASPIDELEDFARNKPQSNDHAEVFSHEDDVEKNSAAAASAAAMKEAMDKAGVRLKHAKEVREREQETRSARSREFAQQERDEEAIPGNKEGHDKEKGEKLERERLQREREEREREQRRLEKEREERERARRAVERATREARERAAAEIRAKVDRAAVDKVNDEARQRAERAAFQRAAQEARERLAAEARQKAEKAAAEEREKAATEAREKAQADRAAEDRKRADRAAVDRANTEVRERAAAIAKQKLRETENDLESFFHTRPKSVPKQRTTENPFDSQFQNRSSGTSSSSSSPFKRPSSSTNIMDDLTSAFGGAPSSSEVFQELHGESEERRKARLKVHQRTQERTAKALAEKHDRDMQMQREQAERHRIAETLDIEIKRWAAGKEGNLRALLSTLQYVLWPECNWQPVPLTDLITAAKVKSVYRRATLCIHPDKVQQKGASLQQKYIAEKVFDLLKEAWNKLNSEELF